MQFYEEKKLYEIDTFVLNISVIGVIFGHKSVCSTQEQVVFAAIRIESTWLWESESHSVLPAHHELNCQ